MRRRGRNELLTEAMAGEVGGDEGSSGTRYGKKKHPKDGPVYQHHKEEGYGHVHVEKRGILWYLIPVL